MINEAVGLKRFSGMGIQAITLLSIAAMPTTIQSGWISDKYTLCTNTIYDYNSATIISDNIGELCLFSDFFNKTIGNIVNIEDISEFVSSHPRKKIKLNITKVKKHVSNFDFEEGYEEL